MAIVTCLMFTVGCDNKSPSKFGKIFDLVMNMIEPFKNQGYHIYMDNYYSSPKLRVEEDTLATGTLRLRKGAPREVLNVNCKTRGEHKKNVVCKADGGYKNYGSQTCEFIIHWS